MCDAQRFFGPARHYGGEGTVFLAITLVPVVMGMAIAATTSLWAQQGVPFQDDWQWLFSFDDAGRLRHATDGLLDPANDGMYPLAKSLMRASWFLGGSLSPIAVLNITAMAALAVFVVMGLHRQTGRSILPDCAVAVCCLNPALVPSFTWSCLLYVFLSIAMVVPLGFAMLRPTQCLHRPWFLLFASVFVALSLANGAMAYTYGMGVSLWCVLAAAVANEKPKRFRLGLGAIGLLGASLAALLYTYTKHSHPQSVHFDVIRSGRVFLETLAAGVGQVGIASRGLLGVAIILAVVGCAIFLLLRGPGTRRDRLLAAASGGIVLLPAVGIALTRNNGLASRYMFYGIPVMLWVYAVARTRFPARLGALACIAWAAFYACTFLYEVNYALVFAKQRHAQATELLNDVAKGWSPLHVASVHASVWNLNKDERFAQQLDAARTNSRFAALGTDPDYERVPAEIVGSPEQDADGWTYRGYTVNDSAAIAMVVEYEPLNVGPYRIRWTADRSGRPATVEEASFQSGRQKMRRDYFWLPPGTDKVWFGTDPRGRVKEVKAFVLRAPANQVR